MVSAVFEKAWQKLLEKPVRLWGFSLLIGLLHFLNITLLGVFFFVSYPVYCILQIGAIRIYLRGYHGEEVYSKHIFEGGKRVLRNVGGMGWYDLWCLIWSFVPVVRWIKWYSYSFVPYLLITDENIEATDALRISMEKTEGYKGQLFLADVFKALIILGIFVVCAILRFIPVLGPLLIFCIAVLTVILFPLFSGLVNAGMFEAITNAKQHPSYEPTGNGSFCPYCGRAVPAGYRCACHDTVQSQDYTESAAQTDENPVRFCSNCKKPLAADITVCPYCNTVQ